MRNTVIITLVLSVASASVVPANLAPKNTVASRIGPDMETRQHKGRKPGEHEHHPVVTDGTNIADSRSPGHPPPSPANRLAPRKAAVHNHETAAAKSTRLRVQRGTEFVYNPIDSSYSQISTAPWWARGEEGLRWTRDEKTGVLRPEAQSAATRLEALNGGMF